MYKGVSYNKPLAVVAGLAVVATLVSWHLTVQAGKNLTTEMRRLNNQVEAKKAIVSELEKTASKEEVKKMEDNVSQWKTRLVPPGTIEKIVHSFGNAWTYNESPPDAEGLVTGDIRYLETSILHWKDIISAARQVENTSPMCSLREISISSDGTHARRRFVGVRMTVRYRPLQTQQAQPTQPVK